MVLQFIFFIPKSTYRRELLVTEFRLILNYMHPTSLAAVTTLGRKTFNRLVVHVDSAIMTYSLDILARLALDKSQVQSLDASIERIGGNDVNIVLCRHIHFNKRALRSYFYYLSNLSNSSSSPSTSSDICFEATIGDVCDFACGRSTGFLGSSA